MTESDESAYRRHYRATGDEVTVRQGDELDNDDDVFELRMPIASTGEVRNEGDDPLTRNELNGMARQLNDREIGVFPAHGSDSMIAAGRYSPFERLGDWTDASIESREDENVLMATARMPDPESLPAATKQYRTALAILKEQAVRGVSQDASIGWRDDDEFPGGVDLMEASIVGIGADWRTNMGDESAEVVARAAVDAGADKDALLERVRAAIDAERPLGPEDDPNRFDDWDDCISAMKESGHSQEEAKRICGSFESDSDEQDADTSDTDTQADDSMTDSDPDDEPTDEQDATDDAETQQVRQSPAEIADMAEDYVMGAVEGAIDDLRDELEDMMDDGGENEGDKPDDEDEDDEEQSADDPDSEQSDDPDDERDADADELRSELDSLREELDDLRDGGVDADDVESPDPDDEQDAEDTDESEAEPTRDTAEDPTEGLGDYR